LQICLQSVFELTQESRLWLRSLCSRPSAADIGLGAVIAVAAATDASILVFDSDNLDEDKDSAFLSLLVVASFPNVE